VTLDAAAVVARLRAAGCVFAEDEADLLMQAARDEAPGETGYPQVLDAMVTRRCAGEPLEQIVGWAAFAGLRIAVGPGVFVPRRRSEFLLALAVDLGRDGGAEVVVDLCCGVAPLATALAAELPEARIHAADIDVTQTAYARRNLAGYGPRAQVHVGDLFEALPAHLAQSVDLLVVNAPYVPTAAIATMPAEARVFEPHTSLDGGADGLAVQRRVAAGAPAWLAPGGHLLIETSRTQAEDTHAAFVAAGLQTRTVSDEDLEATVVIGQRPAT